MSKVYEAKAIDDLQDTLEMAQCTISEYATKTQEFKKYVQGLYIDVYSQDEFTQRVDAIFNEVYKELDNGKN